jgi:hypothetical protein
MSNTSRQKSAVCQFFFDGLAMRLRYLWALTQLNLLKELLEAGVTFQLEAQAEYDDIKYYLEIVPQAQFPAEAPASLQQRWAKLRKQEVLDFELLQSCLGPTLDKSDLEPLGSIEDFNRLAAGEVGQALFRVLRQLDKEAAAQVYEQLLQNLADYLQGLNAHERLTALEQLQRIIFGVD